jgi:NUMOD3 motif-containing protein
VLVYIYELYDPRHPTIVWYVGVSKDPEKRLKEHLHLPRWINSKKYDWICGLLKQGVSPAVRITQCVPITEWQHSERNWILQYRRENSNLTNISDGGSGFPVGRVLSEEHRRRISEGKKGHAVSAETRRKLSAANRGHTLSEEARRKLSEYAGPASSHYCKDIRTYEIVRLYASGLTVYDIAHKFKCGPCLVTDRLRKSSINIRGPHPEQNKQARH